MATVASLFGMTPALVTNCRVLELGCAAGFNLIPMAASLPDSRFVGVDLSPRQVLDGQEAIRSMGLTNIELRPMSIMDVGDEFGRFDYIICHGVFSWVPAEVREKILEIASRNLAPQGVAYVSYNCFPGWHLAGMIREMMLYHIRRFTEPSKRIQQAKAFLDYLAMGTLDQNSSYARLLKEEAELLRRTSESYLFHDHLEAVNQPIYFHEFTDQAAAHGLQYIWESYVGDRAGYLWNGVKETLDRLSTDLIRREQNLDFLFNRRFRESLLCHDDVALDRSRPSELLMSRFHFIGVARPQSSRVDIGSHAIETFRAPGGESIQVDHPICKATLACLHESSPQAQSFDELCGAVRTRLEGAADIKPIPDDELRRGIAALLRECIWTRLVATNVHPMTSNTPIGERPVASPVARYQAKSSDRVANLRHENVALTQTDRNILPLLDGRRDRAALVDALVGMVDAGQIKVEVEGRTVRDKQRLRSVLGEQIEVSLKRLASLGLIER
jgi:methyltransferase-like protein/2-polyprenyl-3-methyl-5-hydroxy-6-metoxy-1,4-benzoquinol methylase